jgi:hypothetical protein
MKKGETAVLTCRADYAYGDSGSPPKIPVGVRARLCVRLRVRARVCVRARARACVCVIV